ncbi:MAG: hypothetical protein RDV41_16085, partial [Planctomycetota bacterium]|nr:hypothetical protein [Planctomycetota bacterium]
MARRIKALANLDVSRTDLSQEGHMTVTHGDKHVEFGVSIRPTEFGENVVVRVPWSIAPQGVATHSQSPAATETPIPFFRRPIVGVFLQLATLLAIAAPANAICLAISGSGAKWLLKETLLLAMCGLFVGTVFFLAARATRGFDSLYLFLVLLLSGACPAAYYFLLEFAHVKLRWLLAVCPFYAAYSVDRLGSLSASVWAIYSIGLVVATIVALVSSRLLARTASVAALAIVLLAVTGHAAADTPGELKVVCVEVGT